MDDLIQRMHKLGGGVPGAILALRDMRTSLDKQLVIQAVYRMEHLGLTPTAIYELYQECMEDAISFYFALYRLRGAR